MNLLKLLLNANKVVSGMAAAVPALEALQANDYKKAGEVFLSWGDVAAEIAKVKESVMAVAQSNVSPASWPALEPALAGELDKVAAKIAAAFAKGLDKAVPEEALLKLIG